MSELSKLKWRCRRGMKELDLLLQRYLDEFYLIASPTEQHTFQTLLELADNDLYDYLLGRKMPTDLAMCLLIQTMRQLTVKQ